ncbi:MAG: acyltransferase [Candidatus Lokiarchaeota archaeon]|nr:acyltransferase [Candidatus Lokiarchaeota archaeon]
MTDKKLPELDILRIISILIVVILIHIPNDYAYSFYIDLDQYTGFYLHTLGIHVAMGSFAFISGFGLYLNKKNRNINTFEKLGAFLKKRFFRIFPLYWVALILFIIFLGYSNMDFMYLLAHVMGLQIMVAPIFGPPILTLWFIGIIVIYYLIFIFLSFLGSIKRIIPASIAILFLFAFLNMFFGLVEYRFFYYYLIFIAGIIAANIYTSPQYNRIKERIINRQKVIPLIIALGVAVLSLILYQFLTQYCFSTFNSEYGTTHLRLILDQNPGFIESAIAILSVDMIIMTYIVFIISSCHFLIVAFRLLLPKWNIGLIFSIIAYSTYCVYLFHRIFLILYTEILMDIFDLAIYERLEFNIVLLFVPFIFLFSYLIQKFSDWVLKLPSKLKSKKP